MSNGRSAAIPAKTCPGQILAGIVIRSGLLLGPNLEIAADTIQRIGLYRIVNHSDQG